MNKQELVHLNLEQVRLEGTNLFIRGWIFCEGYFLDTVQLLFEQEDGNVIKASAALQRRDDVKCVMGPKLCGNCGIEVEMDYFSPQNCRLKLQIMVAGQKIIMDTKEVILANGMGKFSCHILQGGQKPEFPELKIFDDWLKREKIQPCIGRKKTTATCNIGILGEKWSEKEIRYLHKLIWQLQHFTRRKRQIRFFRIGEPIQIDTLSDELAGWNRDMEQLGCFSKEMLPWVLLKWDLDVCLMPTDLDRLGDIRKKIKACNRQILSEKEGCYPRKVLFLIDYYSYAARYRVEHLQEQLLYQGIASDFRLLAETPGMDLSGYGAIVVYRCKDVKLVTALVERAKNREISMYYDVDDYIFDFDAIAGLDFLQLEEYRDFKRESLDIRCCMKLFSHMIVSTEQLKKGILQILPQANVWINRNVASMEMRYLSERALEKKHRDDGRYRIGYFSGSGTHNQDFEMVAPVLVKIMQHYTQVELIVAGCMELPRCMACVAERVHKLEFMDWRQLPFCIAEVDLNIQPLQDTFFHSCKSENKWMEAALVKTVTIASQNEELEQVISDGIDGLLCRTSAQWEKTIIELIENPDWARQIAQNAYDKVSENYLTSKIEKELLHQLENDVKA